MAIRLMLEGEIVRQHDICKRHMKISHASGPLSKPYGFLIRGIVLNLNRKSCNAITMPPFAGSIRESDLMSSTHRGKICPRRPKYTISGSRVSGVAY